MKETIRAYLDLTRLHFFFVWPLLFCAGLFLAFRFHDGFSVQLVIKVALIGFLGFEAGLVLNDIVDFNADKRDVEFDKLTKYWRPFGKRPLSQGLISRRNAILLFGILTACTTALIFTLPLQQTITVLGIMITCYCLEYFYQIKKRNQSFPFAQLIGRIDFTLFSVTGYLCLATPDTNVLLFAFLFYPLAIAHLGVNDLADVANDQARKMKTIPILYGIKGTINWILFFSILHVLAAIVFLRQLGTLAPFGFSVGFLLLAIGNLLIIREKSSAAGIKALPMFHLAMLTYAVTIILDYIV